MRIAQILNDTAHWIFEADAIPGWPPGPDGAEMVFADITGTPAVQEGWLYDAAAGVFTPPEAPTPEPAPVPVPPEPTNTALAELQMIQLAAIADVYEAQQTDALILMDAVATLFEIMTEEV